MSSKVWMGKSSTERYRGKGRKGRLGIHLQHFLLFTPLWMHPHTLKIMKIIHPQMTGTFCLLTASCLEVQQRCVGDNQPQLVRDLGSVFVWQAKGHVSWLRSACVQEPLSAVLTGPDMNGTADTWGLIQTNLCLSASHPLQLRKCSCLDYEQLALNRSHLHIFFHPCSTPYLLLLHRGHTLSTPLRVMSVSSDQPFLTLKHSQKYHYSPL